MPSTVAGVHLGPDIHANRPAANAAGQPVGALYSCTTHSLIYKSDGATWSTYATLGSVAEILDLPTAETDASLVLAPDGAGGVEFRAEAGGGGGSVYPLDSYALDGTYGQLFDAASLPGAFTRRGFTGSGDETFQVGKDADRMRIALAGRGAGDGYYRSISGDGTWAMKFIAHGSPYGCGLGIVNSAGTGVSCGWYASPAAWLVLATTTYSTYGGTFQQVPTPGNAPHTAYTGFPVWCYIRRSGNNFYTSVSLDGEAWQVESAAQVAAITPDRIYIGLDSLPSVGSTGSVVDFVWFNKIA